MPRPAARPLLFLALAGLLGACAGREAAPTPDPDLAGRVEELEREVRELRADLAEVRELTGGDAARVARVAAAQTCGLDLARLMEAFRTDNARYPRVNEIVFPGSCADLRVDWKTLEAGEFAFDVLDSRGRLLVEQRSQ